MVYFKTFIQKSWIYWFGFPEVFLLGLQITPSSCALRWPLVHTHPWCPSFYRDTRQIRLASHSSPTTFNFFYLLKRSCLLIYSHWMLGLQHTNLGAGKEHNLFSHRHFSFRCLNLNEISSKKFSNLNFSHLLQLGN